MDRTTALTRSCGVLEGAEAAEGSESDVAVHERVVRLLGADWGRRSESSFPDRKEVVSVLNMRCFRSQRHGQCDGTMGVPAFSALQRAA